jgi:carboxypeptidase C (cathepsin A)
MKGRAARVSLVALTALWTTVLHAGQSLPDVTAAAAAKLAFGPTATRSLEARAPVVTMHQTTVSGRRIPYRAVVTEFPVKGEDGQPIGVIVTEAYIATGASSGSRPVTFIYNGGPGASSWSMQVEGVGPRVYQPARGSFADNPDSLIDVSDLVFIDPLGTGASFPLANRDAAPVWNTPGDARSVLDVMDQWLRANGRADSPQYLMGASYGTMRSLAVMHADAKRHALHINGIILLSLFLSLPENGDVRAIELLPSMAASAYARGLRPLPASSVADAYSQAMAFARTAYAEALLQGSGLSDERLHTVA